MAEVDEELATDFHFYGACYWKIVDGQKVRVPPRDVWFDSTEVPLEPLGMRLYFCERYINGKLGDTNATT